VPFYSDPPIPKGERGGGGMEGKCNKINKIMLNLKNNNSSSAHGAIKQIESNVEYNSPFIFTKKINTNYKLVPFNIVENDVGKTKYLPPVSKE
jgi:hypothetical protein